MQYPNHMGADAGIRRHLAGQRRGGSAPGRGVKDAGELGFAVWRGRPSAGHQIHTHHDVEVNFVFDGWVEYVLGGRRIGLEAGQMCLFWASIPHQLVQVPDGTRMGWIILPVQWLWQWGMPGAWVASLLEGRVLADAAPEPADADAIASWEAMLDRRDARWRQIAALEVEARFRRMLLGSVRTLGAAAPAAESTHAVARDPAGRGERTQRHPLAAVEAMAAFITARFAEPIKVADIARAVSLHPNYAMRLFRRHMGMSLIDYLTRQRVAEAQRRLMRRDDPVFSVAMGCGFGSASRFHQAFRHLTGTTPARFRRLATQAP